jgi:DNA-binding CsgD family transcriptional regulator
VDKLMELYREGMTLPEPGERFGINHRTVTAHSCAGRFR